MNKSSMSNLPSANGQDGKKDAIVEQAKQAVTHVASNVAEQAREQVNTQFDTRKDKAVETMGNVASAIRETSEKLKGVGPLGDVAGRAADGIESVAGFFEGKQIGDIARDVGRFARREPALFLGAAFAIGLIGGRFLKSSGHRDDSDTEGTGYARQGGGGVGSDRYGVTYGASYGDGGYDDGFLSDDEDLIDSKRFASNKSQPTGRATLPLGSRTAPARSGGSYAASSQSTPTPAGPVPPATPPMASAATSNNGNGNGNGNGNLGSL